MKSTHEDRVRLWERLESMYDTPEEAHKRVSHIAADLGPNVVFGPYVDSWRATCKCGEGDKCQSIIVTIDLHQIKHQDVCALVREALKRHNIEQPVLYVDQPPKEFS